MIFQKKDKQPLEFSKRLTLVDINVYIAITIVLLVILLVRPELGAFAQNIFAYMTTAYVSLRLGYTAKAGVENYKKIAQTYKEVTSINSSGELVYESTATDYHTTDDTEEENEEEEA